MAFSVTVYLPEHLPLINQVPADSDEIDQWMKHCAKLRLYDAPLGSGSIIYDYWSTIGYLLKLPLITSIYNEGLEIDHTQVTKLESEVEQLEKYWKEHTLEDFEKYKVSEAEIKKDLLERIGFLKAAIRITKERRAVLIIS